MGSIAHGQITALVLLSVFTLAPDGAMGQPIGIEGSGQLGVLSPSGRLLAGPGGGETELETSGLLAANLGIRARSGLGLELSGVTSFADGLETASLRAREGGFSALTVHATYRTSIPVVRQFADPFFGVGVGTREVGFGDFGEEGAVIDDQSDVTGVALAGVFVEALPVVGLRLEFRNYFSDFSALEQSNAQNDQAFLGGVTVSWP